MKLAFAPLLQRGFCKLKFSFGVQDANHNEFQTSFFQNLEMKKGFTDSSFCKNENNLPQFQHRKVVSHFLKSWFVAGRFPHCWLFWFSFRFFRVLVDFVDLPTYLIKDYLLKILAQTRLCDYKVFFHQFIFRLGSLQVALVCLLYISFNLIGQQDS